VRPYTESKSEEKPGSVVLGLWHCIGGHGHVIHATSQHTHTYTNSRNGNKDNSICYKTQLIVLAGLGLLHSVL